MQHAQHDHEPARPAVHAEQPTVDAPRGAIRAGECRRGRRGRGWDGRGWRGRVWGGIAIRMGIVAVPSGTRGVPSGAGGVVRPGTTRCWAVRGGGITVGDAWSVLGIAVPSGVRYPGRSGAGRVCAIRVRRDAVLGGAAEGWPRGRFLTFFAPIHRPPPFLISTLAFYTTRCGDWRSARPHVLHTRASMQMRRQPEAGQGTILATPHQHFAGPIPRRRSTALVLGLPRKEHPLAQDRPQAPCGDAASMRLMERGNGASPALAGMCATTSGWTRRMHWHGIMAHEIGT